MNKNQLKQLCDGFLQGLMGSDHAYSFEDCLQDWITVNWAWEV